MSKEKNIDLNYHRQVKDYGYKSNTGNVKNIFTVEEIKALALEHPNDSDLGAAIRKELSKINK